VTRIKDKPSKREVRNLMTFYAGGTNMEAPRTRGRQPESDVNDEVARWRSREPDLLLERNKRRLATPVGYHQPIMLGWLVDGSSDWVGHKTIVITPAMVGKKIAVPVYIEDKSKSGVLSEAQEIFLDNARDAGAIVGVARSGTDCVGIVEMWWKRMIG